MDNISNPKHYNSHPSGIECIEITQEMNFCIGNAIKYLWRADYKGKPIEDFKKAIWCIEREIQRREKNGNTVKETIPTGRKNGINGKA